MTTLPDHLRGDGPCQDCGTPDNIRWFASSAVWNHVIGGVQATDDPGGIVCIPCFVKRADAAGFAPTVWQIAPNWFATERPATGPRQATEDEVREAHATGRFADGVLYPQLIEAPDLPPGTFLAVSFDHNGQVLEAVKISDVGEAKP